MKSHAQPAPPRPGPTTKKGTVPPRRARNSERRPRAYLTALEVRRLAAGFMHEKPQVDRDEKIQNHASSSAVRAPSTLKPKHVFAERAELPKRSYRVFAEGLERNLAWLGRNRRLSKDYEYCVQTSEAMIGIASIRLLLNRLLSTRLLAQPLSVGPWSIAPQLGR